MYVSININSNNNKKKNRGSNDVDNNNNDNNHNDDKGGNDLAEEQVRFQCVFVEITSVTVKNTDRWLITVQTCSDAFQNKGAFKCCITNT